MKHLCVNISDEILSSCFGGVNFPKKNNPVTYESDYRILSSELGFLSRTGCSFPIRPATNLWQKLNALVEELHPQGDTGLDSQFEKPLVSKIDK